MHQFPPGDSEDRSGSWIDADELVSQTLIITPSEKLRQRQLETEGVSTIRPVALARGSYLVGNNKHLGWPVGIKIGATLLCAYHQTLHHHGTGPQSDENTNQAVVVRSTDGGATWSDPIDIRNPDGVNDDEMVLDFGNCFGVLGGSVFLATKYGVYRSNDEGQNWTLLRGALTKKQTDHDFSCHFGPRMIIHPEKGLVVPVGVTLEPFLDLYSSKDEGITWTHERVTVSETIHPLEPTGIYHDGRLIFVSRSHSLPFAWHEEQSEPMHPVMMVSENDWFPMKHQGVTNISTYRWPDTTDVDYNPVSERYEAVVTNRNGGVCEKERDEEHAQTVNLWSISKEDLTAGRADQWRFEATLLRLSSGMLTMGPDDIDSAHPGGAVIDETRGVQHIFIYCGRYATPTGIYRITRTLDTDKPRQAAADI